MRSHTGIGGVILYDLANGPGLTYAEISSRYRISEVSARQHVRDMGDLVETTKLKGQRVRVSIAPGASSSGRFMHRVRTGLESAIRQQLNRGDVPLDKLRTALNIMTGV